jgi:Relaxase/Mobilisation nuclease domain
MIIKGKARGNGAQLGQYLVTPGKNERVQVVEVRGLVATDVPGAVLEMDAIAACTRMTQPLYHASINTPIKERLTDAQRAIAVDRLEAELGFTGQPRVVVIHQKASREHTHIVWSRTDVEHMRGIPISHNYRGHEEVSRALEREFGHERVQGAHAERDGKKRPERTPSRAEMQQAERTGITRKEVKERVTELRRGVDNPADFAKALWDAGFVLARGDRRDFVVIDQRGGTHSLARVIEGAKAKDVREFMAGLDASRIPTVADAKKIQRARQERDAGRDRDTSREPAPEAPKPSPQTRPEPTAAPEAGRPRASVAGAAAHAAGSLLDGIASLFERGLSGEGHAQRDIEQKPEPRSDPMEEHRAASVRATEDAAAQRRQALLREFGRDMDNEYEAEFERGRERRRGE